MARGLKRTYFINGKSYSITDLLGFRGVRDAVSSRTTECSKRELLHSMLRGVTKHKWGDYSGTKINARRKLEWTIRFNKLDCT